MKLDGSHLGIADHVLQLLEGAAEGGYAAKISHRLKDAANKLQARQKIIYNRYTVSNEPFRIVHESALPKALEAIEEMKAQADALREEILGSYEEEYACFLEWVYQVLTAAVLEADAIEIALRQYAQTYPTLEELQANSLRVLVAGPILIPSLLQRSQQEAELAQQHASQEATEVEKQKLKLLQRSQETLQQTLLSTLLSFYAGGGTEWEPALQAAIDCIEKQQHCKQADIILVTDGQCDVDQEFVKQLKRQKEQLEFTIYGILIGATGEQRLKKLCDRVWVVKDLVAEEVVIEELFLL